MPTVAGKGTDPGTLHDTMAAAAQGTIRRAFFQAVRDTRAALDREALMAALERRDATGALSLLDAALAAEGFHRVGQAIGDAAIRAGRTAAAEVDAHLKSIAKRDARFSLLNPQTVAAVQGWARGAVEGLTRQTRAVAERVVRAGLAAGRSVAQIVSALVASLGLSERDAERVEGYEAALIAGERDAVSRAARDPRADAAVLRAVAERKPLDPAYIANLANRMRTKLLAERGFAVADWQAKQIASGSVVEAWRQAAADGLVDAASVFKVWVNRGDHLVRHAHVDIPLRHPDGVPLDTAFTSILGPIRFPHDPEAALANTANCRCVLRTEVRS